MFIMHGEFHYLRSSVMAENPKIIQSLFSELANISSTILFIIFVFAFGPIIFLLIMLHKAFRWVFYEQMPQIMSESSNYYIVKTFDWKVIGQSFGLLAIIGLIVFFLNNPVGKNIWAIIVSIFVGIMLFFYIETVLAGIIIFLMFFVLPIALFRD